MKFKTEQAQAAYQEILVEIGECDCPKCQGYCTCYEQEIDICCSCGAEHDYMSGLCEKCGATIFRRK